ncbi:uncharacterized protein LOC122663044 [Telopea speciosissima]|uniref:uncharacterized protein LOC122663044 n=1 Tax=Telopea speciosissima TaxID=54955 RepID=UPI001CC3A888|nr:uncharacterized protein LOC122663044 [Telopea speciosissima]
MPSKRLKSEASISFSKVDLEGISFPHDDALVVQMEIAKRPVHRVLVDTGASVDLMSLDVYRQFGFRDDALKPEGTSLHGFSGAATTIKGLIDLLDELIERRGRPVEDLIPFSLSDEDPTKTVQLGSLLGKE